MYLSVADWLAEQGAKRDATVVALGGGVVGDLAGFAAATYLRGVGLVQIPTTLLAQVDSSVGGKVGVDLRQGKNLLGAFYPPTEVRICVDALDTLPERQWSSGLAEVLKTGFIMEPSILDQADPGTRAEIRGLVEVCIDCKRRIVEADELETTGLRSILNFGHTVGHAIETALGYEELLHGEAISIGMTVEAELSERLGLAQEVARPVRETLAAHDLPTSHPILTQGRRLLELMAQDKKSLSDSLAFSLLRSIGQCELVRAVPAAEVLAALESVAT